MCVCVFILVLSGCCRLPSLLLAVLLVRSAADFSVALRLASSSHVVGEAVELLSSVVHLHLLVHATAVAARILLFLVRHVLVNGEAFEQRLVLVLQDPLAHVARSRLHLYCKVPCSLLALVRFHTTADQDVVLLEHQLIKELLPLVIGPVLLSVLELFSRHTNDSFTLLSREINI